MTEGTKTETLRTVTAGHSHLVLNGYHATTSQLKSRDGSALNLETSYLSYFKGG